MKRRLKYLFVGKDFLAALLKTGSKTVYDGKPHDATIINVVYRPELDVYHIIVHSYHFKELAECELIPELKHISIITK